MKKMMNLIAMVLCAICVQAVEFDYDMNRDGTVTITKISGIVSEELKIPPLLEGKPVTVIGHGVMAGDEEDGIVPLIETLIVPEGVRRIDGDSFSRCPYLARIVLPKSLEEIGDGVFTAGADSLPFNDYKWKDYENFGIRNIQVADGNSAFEVKDGVLIDRKSGVAIVCCVNAMSVSLPEGVREIGEHCFAYCQDLSTIWFPSSLRAIRKEAFLFCRQLKALDFSNTSLSEVNKNAFGGCVNLQEVKFPAALQSIGKDAFYWCNALKSVTYEGDAPTIEDAIYTTSNDDLSTPRLLPDSQRREMPLSGAVSYVKKDTTGWGAVPGEWQGCPIRYVPWFDLEHNYAFETGVWRGWTYAEMEDYRSHDQSGETGNPWSFEFGVDQLQNIAIPVRGCGSEKICPVIVLGTATEADKLTALVLTEQEMANKFGIGKYRFERDDDEWEYENERNKVDVSFPDSAWPELKPVADRQWIVVSMDNVKFGKDGFFSPKTFSVGVLGTGLMTPLITILPDDALPPTTNFTPKNVFGVDVELKGVDSDSECQFNPDFKLWTSGLGESERVTYEFDTDDENDDDEYGCLNVAAPAKGVLYVKLEGGWYLEEIKNGRLKFSGAVLDGGASVITEGGEQWDIGEVWCVLKTKSAGVIKISGYGEKLYVDGIWFKSNAVDLSSCLATTAWYREDVQLANDRYCACYRCYVTGMGVTKFGDKATLVCHPNEGEVLDHWEFVNCNTPADATVANSTLTFTVSKELYDQIDGIDGVPRRVIVRPVLKKRRQIVVIPMPCGAATVDGNGYYFEDEKATIKLSAAEGCRFRSWSDGSSAGPTRTFYIGASDVHVCALFDGVPSAQDAGSWDAEYRFVPGEKVSLVIPELIGYTAKGLPSGLKLNKKTGEISGAAKKPTGEAGVTVAFTKKGAETLTAQFVVGPMPTIEIALAGDTEKCKVKGAGSYLVGKKVSLSATAPKGTAFVGWSANGVLWPNAEDSKKAKLSYVMTKESVSLVATFEKEKMRVACPALAAASFTVGVAGDATGIPIEIETQSGVKSVAVSKLPAGMKYDKKTGLIVGAPTKAGSFDAAIKVTAKSGAVETLVVPVRVAALPDWAVGTFVGMVRQVDYDAQDNVIVDADGRHDWYDGEMTVTVSAKGKISGKLTLPGGEKGAFSIPAYDSCGEEGCVASGNMKIGKTLKVDVELRVTVRSLSGGDADFVGDVEVRMHGNEGADTLVTFTTDESRPLRQQIWKAKTLPLPPSVDKKSVAMERGGFLYTLNFGKNGAVNDVLASSDDPKKAIKKGKPVFSIVGFLDSVWHCELFGTPIVDTAGGGEERLRVNVNITSDGSLSCALAE